MSDEMKDVDEALEWFAAKAGKDHACAGFFKKWDESNCKTCSAGPRSCGRGREVCGSKPLRRASKHCGVWFEQDHEFDGQMGMNQPHYDRFKFVTSTFREALLLAHDASKDQEKLDALKRKHRNELRLLKKELQAEANQPAGR